MRGIYVYDEYFQMLQLAIIEELADSAYWINKINPNEANMIKPFENYYSFFQTIK